MPNAIQTFDALNQEDSAQHISCRVLEKNLVRPYQAFANDISPSYLTKKVTGKGYL
jgi:hypothetical protein